MNIYVETNFILELAFLQEQHESCEQIVTLGEKGSVKLVLPIFCIAESYEKLIRQKNKRRQIRDDVEREIYQLSRSKTYKEEIDDLRRITGLLVHSSEEEDQRLQFFLERILKIADTVPFDASIVSIAKQCRLEYHLLPQDSFVYSSVSHHLQSTRGAESCFLSKDRDFSDIQDSLEEQGCKMVFGFDKGYSYIQHCLNSR